MPKTRAKVDAFISDLHVKFVCAVIIIAREAHGTIALEHGDPAAGLRQRDAHGMLYRAPFARKIGDGDAARAALVHAPDAVARLGDREERGLHQPPFTRSSFFTWVTPRTRRATSAARFLVSCESTTPLSVTMPLSLSTLMRRSVFSPTSFMSAVCTLAVSAASTAKRVFFCRPSSVAWSLVFSCAAAAAAASSAQRTMAVRFMGSSRLLNCRPKAPARGSRSASRSA